MSRKIGYALVLLLTLSYSCSQNGKRMGEIRSVSDLCAERLDNNCLPLDPWFLTRDSSGVTASYRFLSQDCLCTSDPVLLCQDAGSFTVSMNEMPLIPNDDCFMIAGVTHEGENVIELHGRQDIGSVSLSGEFGVWADEEGGWYVDKARPLETGLLASQGLPFYSGEVSYRRQYEVPEKVGRRILRIPSWKGEACSVWVNYQKVADVTPGRFKMDIGPYLEAGTNDIEVRISGASGTFGLLKAFTLE